MPHLPFASNNAPEDDMQHVGSEHDPPKRKNSVLERGLGRIQKIGHWFRDDEAHHPIVPLPENPKEGEEEEEEGQAEEEEEGEESTQQSEQRPTRRPSLLGRRGYKRVVPELPRPLTFRRQNSEKRDRLLPVEQPVHERRAVSADRRPRDISSKRRGSPPLTPLPSLSAPEVSTPIHRSSCNLLEAPNIDLDLDGSNWPEPLPHEPPNLSPLGEPPPLLEDDARSDVLDERELQADLESKWILNLSMHFRDKSDREKFFVTYAQEPNKWRRVTVSLDYRDADPESLEADLKTLHYQRDKSARIYEAVRDSLADIQFFDTVTNLKLQTDDGRLHVHVTEDVNEVISYPSTSLVEHVHCRRYHESELEFDAHLSGFVYRVGVEDHVLIKKEIPGPDTVDEFLYEINALSSLQDSRSVIKFHGLVINEDGSLVKGLLISFAPRGSLVDMLYDYKGTDQLPWDRREQWAYQIIQGLSEIHEAGFVQGDFTLSNIVIDGEDDAKIIDINRRGCPVGWEPPELLSLIRSGQRISMCIGVKSDLFQLGMVLWALAEKHDEPENMERIDNRLPPVADEETPLWFKRIVETCLSEKPRDRASAKDLLYRFPPVHTQDAAETGDLKLSQLSDHSTRSRRSDKQYIDPAAAVHLEDIEEHRRGEQGQCAVPPSHLTSEPYTFADAAPSTNYRYYSEGSYTVLNRNQGQLSRHRRPSSSATSVSSTNASESRRRRVRRRYVCSDDEDTTSSRCGPAVDGVATAYENSENRPPSLDVGRTQNVPSGKYARFANDMDSSQGADRVSGEDLTVQQVRRQESAYFNPPLHQDSGFDEHMIAGIESSHPVVDIQPFLPELENDSRPETEQPNITTATVSHLGHLAQPVSQPPAREPLTSQSPPEPLTPFSYYTPLTTPLHEAAENSSSVPNAEPNRPANDAAAPSV